MNLNIFHLFHGVRARGIYPTSKCVERGWVQNYDLAPSPFFGKHLENAVLLAWKAKSIIKAKEKRSCLKPNDICFFIFCHFWKLDPTFRLLLKLVLHFRPIFGPTPTTFQSTYNDLQPPNFPVTEDAPLRTFMHVLSKSLSFTLPPTHTPLLL
jgi:hypothetical protein